MWVSLENKLSILRVFHYVNFMHNLRLIMIINNFEKELMDYWPEYENYMNQVRQSVQNERCRFGRSKESKILIGIIAIGGLILLVIGLMIGHCSIIAYRK